MSGNGSFRMAGAAVIAVLAVGILVVGIAGKKSSEGNRDMQAAGSDGESAERQAAEGDGEGQERQAAEGDGECQERQAAGGDGEGQERQAAGSDGENSERQAEGNRGENQNLQAAPVRSFTNLCAYDGRVYCGARGFFGEEIPLESNVFTIWDGKVYYVEKIQEAYDSLTDELTQIKRANMDGSDVEVLAEDVFLAGAGYEKLIGDKLFYGCGYDAGHCMEYAWVDVDTKERGRVPTGRIESILGYDGIYLYYRGVDRVKEQNMLGRVHLKSGKDETLDVFAAVDEEGYIENTVYADGKFYCLTLAHKPEGYDYRTFLYRMEIKDGSTGETVGEVPVDFTGSANYSFLVQDGKVYTAMAGEVVEISADSGSKRVLSVMEEGEYWGIMYFIPGDGYLYYEAIAETDEETGNNDYFYRVPEEGGEKELLSEWYTA